MSILIKGMEMPKDCPMCHFANWDFTGEFRGCNAVNGKKYAMETEPGYPETNFRPSWCPLIPVPDHGRLIDADALSKIIKEETINQAEFYADRWHPVVLAYGDCYDKVQNAPTIIPEDKEGE